MPHEEIKAWLQKGDSDTQAEEAYTAAVSITKKIANLL